MAVFLGDGSLSNPSICFASDTDSGFYKQTNNQISIITGGAEAIRLRDASTASSMLVNVGISVASGTVNGSAVTFRGNGTGANDGFQVGDYISLPFLMPRTSDGSIAETAYMRAVSEGTGSSWPTAFTIGTRRFGTDPTEKLRVTSEGYLRLARGVQFNNDTSADNELDDYEEGTWTPTYSGWTSAPSTTTGRYIKIGKMVYLGLQLGSCTSAAGGSNIGGLPYDAGSSYDMCGLIVDRVNTSPENPASGAVLGIALKSTTIYVERTALTLRDRSALTITYRVA